MQQWILTSGFHEVKSDPLKATWKECLQLKKAALDRALVYLVNTQVSPLMIHWAQQQPVLDHALVLMRFAKPEVGIGFAGACRPSQSKHEMNCSGTMEY